MVEIWDADTFCANEVSTKSHSGYRDVWFAMVQFLDQTGWDRVFNDPQVLVSAIHEGKLSTKGQPFHGMCQSHLDLHKFADIANAKHPKIWYKGSENHRQTAISLVFNNMFNTYRKRVGHTWR